METDRLSRLLDAIKSQAIETVMCHRETSGMDSYEAINFANSNWHRYLTDKAREVLEDEGLEPCP